MSEAYLITGSELSTGTPLDEVISIVCKNAGIKPRQIDEIHLYTDAASALFHRMQDSEAGPVFSWPLLPLLPAAGLHSLCRSLEDDEISLCLLVEISAQRSSAVLLANPNAVGRYNLTPLVLLANRLSEVNGMDNLLTTALKTLAIVPVEIEPKEPAVDLRLPKPAPPQPWLSLHSSETITGLDWSTSRLMQSSSLCGSLVDLAFAMSKTRTDRGIWMSIVPDGPILSTLVFPL
jgi:hypothetical protein